MVFGWYLPTEPWEVLLVAIVLVISFIIFCFLLRWSSRHSEDDEKEDLEGKVDSS